MNKYHKKFIIGLSVLGLGATALVAHAEKEGSEHRHGPMSQGCMQGEGKGKFAEHMKARMEKHQAELHDKLKLSADQEPAWKIFIAAMMPPAGALQPMMDHAAMQKLPAPERMEKMMGKMKEHEAHMNERLAALKTFYATLNADQKKTFDDNAGRGHFGSHEESDRHAAPRGPEHNRPKK